jgi:hypothetical protein
MSEKPRKYKIELTEYQLRILSFVCDQYSRLICGQGWEYQQLFEAAWERRAAKETGHSMDKHFEGGWGNMRDKAEQIINQIKALFWGMGPNAHYGIHYDKTADLLFEMHQVIRHQLWLDTPENERSQWTVDASEALTLTDEPLIKVEQIKEK